jgi:hypothetical protein
MRIFQLIGAGERADSRERKRFVRGRVTEADRRRVGAALASHTTGKPSRTLKARSLSRESGRRGVSTERKLLRPRGFTNAEKGVRAKSEEGTLESDVGIEDEPMPPPPPITPRRPRTNQAEFKTPLQELWG